MTKTERKNKAQERLLDALSAAYYGVADDDDLTDDEKEEALCDLDVQRNRIGKLFGSPRFLRFTDRPW